MTLEVLDHEAKFPINGKYYFFVDTCLPFSVSISCAHFQKVSDTIAAIVEDRTAKKVTNYLCDYLFVAFFGIFVMNKYGFSLKYAIKSVCQYRPRRQCGQLH